MKVLVLTETDACCGPMAAAFLRDYSLLWEVVSAGKHPAQSVDPLVVEVMHECLINLESYVPQDWHEINESDFDACYRCPEKKVPRTLGDYRVMRDFIKNDAYLFFQKIFRQT